MITTTEAKKIKIEDIFIEIGQEFNDGWVIKDIYSSSQKYKTIILFENKNTGVLRKLEKATILSNYKKTGEIKLSYEKSYDLVVGDSFRSKDYSTIKVLDINSEENKILFENSGIEIWLSFKIINQIDRTSGLENSNMFTLRGFNRQKNLEVNNIIPLSDDVYCQIEFVEDGYIYFKDSRGWDFRVQKSTFFRSELLHQSEAEIINSSINYQKIKIYYENKVLIEDKYIIIDDEYFEDSSKKKRILFEEIETGYIYIWSRQSLNNYFSGKVNFNPTFLKVKEKTENVNEEKHVVEEEEPQQLSLDLDSREEVVQPEVFKEVLSEIYNKYSSEKDDSVNDNISEEDSTRNNLNKSTSIQEEKIVILNKILDLNNKILEILLNG